MKFIYFITRASSGHFVELYFTPVTKMDPDPTPDPTPFFSDFKEAHYLQSLKPNVGETAQRRLYFVKSQNHCTLLNTFMINGKDPDYYFTLVHLPM